MYTSFYKLTDRPFQLSPDPRFFFGSRGHRKAMAYLTYGLNQGEGFIIITGDIGMGKTTLVGHLFSELDSQKYVAAKVVTTQLAPDDTLRMVAAAFSIPFEDVDKATLLKRIEAFCLQCAQEGRRVLLVIDEAQNLPVGSIEELRMLSNFQSGEKALLQCFLLGQPQFRAMVATPALEQLRQRVIASYHLEPMDADETRAYVEHRLRTVGWQNDPSFTDETFRLIHARTGGVPRRINTLCSRLLLFGFLEELHVIDAAVVEEVATDLMREGVQTQKTERSVGVAMAAGGGPAGANPGPSANLISSDLRSLEKRVAAVEEHAKQQDRIIRRALEIAARFLEGGEDEDSEAPG
jgi:putative secretion ATPase (PEP-CTERM system associated)